MCEFHIRLKTIRQTSGRKLKEVAAALEVELRTYQGYEMGEREPNIARLIALADFFGVTLDYLMGRTEEKT